MIRIGAFLTLALTALLAISPRVHAAEGYDNCTGFITSIPTVITTQGTWCLKQDLSTSMSSGNAITINTNNVTIDCNDFKIGGLSAGVGTQANGIVAGNRLNETVRHCNVRGFFIGVLLFGGSSSGGHVVEDNRFDNNTWIGLRVDGDGSVVRGNRVFDTGASTVPGLTSLGISTTLSVDVFNNIVSGVFARSGSNADATGIATNSNTSGSISNNSIRAVLKDGTGVARGIFNTIAGRITLRDNDVLGNASAGSIGFSCDNSTSHALNNEINGFATGLSGCIDDGGNVASP